MNPLAKCADKCRTKLGQQLFTASEPGSILGDVETMLSALGGQSLATKSRQGNLPAEVLPELNARLASPIALDLKRPLLRDYPNVAGVYVLLRVMDLVRVEGKRLHVAPENLERWRELNPAEQYFALFEAWLLRGEDAVLGVETRRDRWQFKDNVEFLVEFRWQQWRNVREGFHTYVFTGGISTWNLQLHARFGLFEAEPLPLAGRSGESRGWMLGRARRTAWGKAVAWAMAELIEKVAPGRQFFLRLPDGADFGYLQSAFRPQVAAWEKIYRPSEEKRRAGRYIFKLRFSDRRASRQVWRRLAVPSGASLDELAYAVLNAVDFTDTEHLYEFRYRDHLGRARTYNHPYDEEGPFATEITVGECGLPEKGTMEFRFDYGDDWRFELYLERMEKTGGKKRHIDLLEEVGEAPLQYPNWEE